MVSRQEGRTGREGAQAGRARRQMAVPAHRAPLAGSGWPKCARVNSIVRTCTPPRRQQNESTLHGGESPEYSHRHGVGAVAR
eukprot:519758-Pleurochrysis_carterae.AAC.2